MRDLILGVHIAVGVGGLIAGPAGVFVAGALPVFHWLVFATCVSAIALVPFDWSGLWFFIPIAAASYAFAYLGYRAAGRHSRIVRGYGGAYIALWTAVFIVSASGTPVLWGVPPLVGIPLIEWITVRSARLAER
jgi:hypothetical protein